MRAALNGVLGDHLVETANPLAISMRCAKTGRLCSLKDESLAARVTPHSGRGGAGARPVSERPVLASPRPRSWRRAGARSWLHTDLSAIQHRASHFRKRTRPFAEMLTILPPKWPCRSRNSLSSGTAWAGLSRAARAITALRRPRLAPASHASSSSLGRRTMARRWSAAATGSILRSARSLHRRLYAARPGSQRRITDLRYGNLLDSRLAGPGPLRTPRRYKTSRPPSRQRPVFCNSCGDGDTISRLRDRFVGDGLVPLASALGHHDETHRALGIPDDRQWIGRGMNHFDLLSREEVYEQIKLWLNPEDRLSQPIAGAVRRDDRQQHEA